MRPPAVGSLTWLGNCLWGQQTRVALGDDLGVAVFGKQGLL